MGDTLAVAGELGWSAAGYHLWHNGIDGFDALRRRHLVPEPPYGQGRVAADAGATAMTDVSDGLVADLGHVAEASGVGINVSTAALAADRRRRCPQPPPRRTPTCGHGCSAAGKTHALVATFPGTPPDGWRVIGTVVDGPRAGAGRRRRSGTEIRAGSHFSEQSR